MEDTKNKPELEEETVEEVTLSDAEEDESQDDLEGSETDTQEEEEIEVSFSDSKPSKTEEGGNSTIRQMRQRIKDLEKQNKQFQSQVAPPIKSKPVKPSMADPEIDYDEEKYSEAMLKFARENADFEREQEEEQNQLQRRQDKFNERQASYVEAKKAFKDDFIEDAESIVRSAFDDSQQSIMLMALSEGQSANMVYALGKNPDRLEALSKIKDPIEFTAELVRLEGKIKVSNRKPTTAPEKRTSANGATGGTTLQQAKRHFKKGQETGDMSDYRAFVRTLDRATQKEIRSRL